MYLRMSRRAAQRGIERAGKSPRSAPGVEYPEWYLVHWHFLPNGYLSPFSVSGYDQLFRRFYYLGQQSRVDAQIARALYRRFPDGHILEIGCGPGRLLEAIDEAGSAAEIVGVDLSPFQLEHAHARNTTTLSPTRTLHADAAQLPFETGSFDAAVASHVIGHVPRAAAEGILEEAYRVVRPGGRLLLYEHRWHSIPTGPWLRLGSQSIRGALGRLITLERGA